MGPLGPIIRRCMALIEMKTQRIEDEDTGEMVEYKLVDADAVHCCEQELTEEQKAQARANIGAASPEDVESYVNEAILGGEW